MFVVTDELLANFVVLEQFLRLPGIFARDQRNFIAKYAYGTKRDVSQIPDWRGDCVKSARQTLSSVSPRWTMSFFPSLETDNILYD